MKDLGATITPGTAALFVLVRKSTPDKVLALGRCLQLREGSRVLDFGCGYAEPLALWAARFGMLIDQFGTPWMVNAGQVVGS